MTIYGNPGPKPERFVSRLWDLNLAKSPWKKPLARRRNDHLIPMIFAYGKFHSHYTILHPMSPLMKYPLEDWKTSPVYH